LLKLVIKYKKPQLKGLGSSYEPTPKTPQWVADGCI